MMTNFRTSPGFSVSAAGTRGHSSWATPVLCRPQWPYPRHPAAWQRGGIACAIDLSRSVAIKCATLCTAACTACTVDAQFSHQKSYKSHVLSLAVLCAAKMASLEAAVEAVVIGKSSLLPYGNAC